MPDAIQTLEERLRGRFKWGLITDIQPPDVETRLAILRNKAERDRVQVPAETLEFIASKISHQHPRARRCADPRHRLRQPQRGADHDRARPAAARRPADRVAARSRAPTPRCSTEIAGYLGFEVEALKGKSRQRPLVTGRQIAMYVFREQTDLSYPSIARLFGGRDHTTVIHAVEKIQRQMGERKAIYEQVTDVIQHGSRHDDASSAGMADGTGGHTRGHRRADRWTTPRRPPNHTRVIRRAVDTVDNRRATTHALRWADTGLSTIHSTYYCY